MNVITAIPILNTLIKYLTAPTLLKEKEKEIKRLRLRIRKLEKSIK